MREIKFRGKRIDNNEWVFGSLLTWLDGTIKILVEKEDESQEIYTVIPESVGQFTGLKDKNGVEIYESDILQFITNGFDAETFITAIIFDKCSFKLQNNRSLFYFGQSDFTKVDDVVVIGNIYENPELL